MTHVGMICYIQNPDTPKHHQLTWTNNKPMLILHLQISMLLCNFDTNTSQSFHFHVSFQLWYASNSWRIILAQSQKAHPKQPLDLASYEEEEHHKLRHFHLGICTQQPFGKMIWFVFFLLKTSSMISSFWSIWNHTPTIGEFVNQAHIILGFPNFQYLIFLVHLKFYNLRL